MHMCGTFFAHHPVLSTLVYQYVLNGNNWIYVRSVHGYCVRTVPKTADTFTDMGDIKENQIPFYLPLMWVLGKVRSTKSDI